MSETWIHIEDAGRYLTDVPLSLLVALLKAIADEIENRAERQQ